MSESEGPGSYGRAHFWEQRLSLATQPRDPTRRQLGVSNLVLYAQSTNSYIRVRYILSSHTNDTIQNVHMLKLV